MDVVWKENKEVGTHCVFVIDNCERNIILQKKNFRPTVSD